VHLWDRFLEVRLGENFGNVDVIFVKSCESVLCRDSTSFHCQQQVEKRLFCQGLTTKCITELDFWQCHRWETPFHYSFNLHFSSCETEHLFMLLKATIFCFWWTVWLSSVFPIFIYLFKLLLGLRVWTQVYIHSQIRHSTTWTTPPVHFALVILEMEPPELFAWADLKLRSSWSQPPM
jgi:hypothetical protein